MDLNAYKQYAEQRAKRSPCLKNSVFAFLIGGLICCIGQALNSLYLFWGLSEKHAALCVTVTLVFAAGLLTGIGVFDKIAQVAGAGTLVPITGFANAVSSAAIDSKTEGFVLGVGAKMFTIAGPVIVYGISAGVVYGAVYWVMTML